MTPRLDSGVGSLGTRDSVGSRDFFTTEAETCNLFTSSKLPDPGSASPHHHWHISAFRFSFFPPSHFPQRGDRVWWLAAAHCRLLAVCLILLDGGQVDVQVQQQNHYLECSKQQPKENLSVQIMKSCIIKMRLDCSKCSLSSIRPRFPAK
jgi:hypothetical protein